MRQTYSANAIEKANLILRKGGVVAFPTDTVYGIGADPFQPEALGKLYKIKDRPLDKAIPILVESSESVKKIATNLPEIFWELTDRFWPGALTLVVKSRNLPAEVTADQKTVGVRMPNHHVILELLRDFGGILAATSANRSGQPPATSAKEVENQLGNSIDLIIDSGKSSSEVASTVLDISVDRPKILRQGKISLPKLTQRNAPDLQIASPLF